MHQLLGLGALEVEVRQLQAPHSPRVLQLLDDLCEMTSGLNLILIIDFLSQGLLLLRQLYLLLAGLRHPAILLPLLCFHFIENDLLVFDFETFRLRPFVWNFQTGHLLLCIFLRSVSFGVQGWEVGVHRQWKRQLGKAKGFGYANSLTR